MAPFYFCIISSLSLTVIISVIVNTYLLVHANKTAAFYAYISTQVLIAVWTIFRMGELFAPTPDKLVLCKTIEQITTAIIFTLIILLNILLLVNKKQSTKWLICFCVSLISITLFLIAEENRASSFYFLTPAIVAFISFTVTAIPVLKNHKATNSILSLKSVINNIGDCILVLDTKGKIMDANFSFFSKLFTAPPNTFKEFAHMLQKYLPDSSSGVGLVNNPTTTVDSVFELSLNINAKRLYYLVRITPMYSQKNAKIGEIVTFHDITDNKHLLLELDEKNAELTLINEQLKDYLLVVNQLEEAKEKKEIVFNVQNSIGQEIMELLSMLEVARIKINDKCSYSISELELAIDACRKVIGEIRSSVSILMKKHG